MLFLRKIQWRIPISTSLLNVWSHFLPWHRWSLLCQVSISKTFYDQLLEAQIPKAQKRESSCQSFLRFRDMRAARKAAHGTLIKLTPGVNFINVKRAHFLYKHLFSSYVLALNKLWYEKFVHKNIDEIDTWCTKECDPLTIICWVSFRVLLMIAFVLSGENGDP